MSLSLRLTATGLSGLTLTICLSIPLIFDIIISALGVLLDLFAISMSLLVSAQIMFTSSVRLLVSELCL